MRHPIILEAYTRSEAIEHGLLVDVTDIAGTVGFPIPVALTWAAWAASIEWAPNVQARRATPELAERVREVLTQCAGSAQQSAVSPGELGKVHINGMLFQVGCGNSHHPIHLTLKAAFPMAPADELGITIMLPDEF